MTDFHKGLQYQISQNQSSESQGDTYGQTDMSKLIYAFRGCANVPKQASNNGMVRNNNLERMHKEANVPSFRVLSWNLCWGLRKATEYVCQDRWCPDQNSNLAHHECNSKAWANLFTKPNYTVTLISNGKHDHIIWGSILSRIYWIRNISRLKDMLQSTRLYKFICNMVCMASRICQVM